MTDCSDSYDDHGWIEEIRTFVEGFDWDDHEQSLRERPVEGDEVPEDRTGMVEVYRVYADADSDEVLGEFDFDDSAAEDGWAHFLLVRADHASITAGDYFYRRWTVTPDGLELPVAQGVFRVQEGRP